MKNILAIGAHYDDLEVLCGSTLAKCVQKGYNVIYAIATNAPYYFPTPEDHRNQKYLSNNEISELRKSESRKAAKILGIKKIYFFDYKCLSWYPPGEPPSGGQSHRYLDGVNSTTADFNYLNTRVNGREFLITAHITPKSLSHLSRFINRHSIDTIFTNTPDDFHSEHTLNASFVTKSAQKTFEKTGKKIDIFASESGSAGKLFSIFTPTHYVDITDTLAIKEKAINCFVSQSKDQDLSKYVKPTRKRAKQWGKIFGVDYAEVFTQLNSSPQIWCNITKSGIYDISKAKKIL